MSEPLVRVAGLSVEYPLGRKGLRGHHMLRAVDGVDVEVRAGETLAVVGESGSGKSTLGAAILRDAPISAGTIQFKGQDITALRGKKLRRLRRHMQLIFQDAQASLNPRMTILEAVAEPLIIHGIERDLKSARGRVTELLELCGLPADTVDRLPRSFSGGQGQRIAIARALTLEPDLIVADEPTSALDVSVQAQIVNLLQDLQQRLGLTYIFISHDLSVVRHIADRVAVMYGGRLMEVAPNEDLYSRPSHPYTQALLDAVPIPDPKRKRKPDILPGELPDLRSRPRGCVFAQRCVHRRDECIAESPRLREISPGQSAACHFAEEVRAERRASGDPHPADTQ